eukprot:g15164.t1
MTGLQCVSEPAQAPKVLVRRHYNTVYRQIPENHYVHVQMPEQPPIVHNVQVMSPAKQYDCGAQGTQPDPTWSEQHTRWCCYKYKMYCPHRVVDKDYYHTVTKVQQVKVPVPEPMPTHAPIVHTIHHTYHVPSPPQYVHVQMPGPTVVKPVVVNEKVPYPVREPPQIINVKKPYPVHIKGPDHYVKVPVPSPPHVVTRYHTQWNTVVDSDYDCNSGFDHWKSLWSHAKQSWCCSHQNVGCPGHWVKTVHVIHSYDCHAGFSNWYHGWSSPKKDWCCSHKQMGCPGTWHGHWHAHAVVHVQHVHGVGKGGYDCNAGASNWIQGWSTKKKDWCCSNGHSQYCVKFHCHGEHGDVNAWSSDQRDFCCKNFQLGCPHTTLSPLGCDAQCSLNGETSTCKQRIDWTQENVFGSKSNACNLAYSKIQVECDVCRACTIQAAGCGEQGPGKAAFDCYAALGNWCREWSRSEAGRLTFVSVLSAQPVLSAWRSAFQEVVPLEHELSTASVPLPSPSSYLSNPSSSTKTGLEHLAPSPAKEWLLQTAKGSHGTPCCVVIVGPRGSGKSTFLAALKSLPMKVLPMFVPALINAGIGDTHAAVRKHFERAHLHQPSCITLEWN